MTAPAWEEVYWERSSETALSQIWAEPLQKGFSCDTADIILASFRREITEQRGPAGRIIFKGRSVKPSMLYPVARGRRGAALKFFCSFAFIALIGPSSLSRDKLRREHRRRRAWSGVLRNAGGAPIADARVKLTSGESKAEGRTGADGRFLLPLLPAGNYHLTVAAMGSTVECAQPVDLTANTPEALITPMSGRGELSGATLSKRKSRRAQAAKICRARRSANYR